MPAVSKAEFARSLGVSKPRVSQYVSRGLPVLANGKVDLDKGTRWVAENHYPNDRHDDRGAARATELVKSKPSKPLPVNPVTAAPLNTSTQAMIDNAVLDAMAHLVGRVGPIAAAMAVEAGADMKIARALDVMVATELRKVATAYLREPLRTEVDASDWPEGEYKEPDFSALAAKAGEAADLEAWDDYLDVLPWSRPPEKRADA